METCLAGADEWRGETDRSSSSAAPRRTPLRRVLRGGAAGWVRAHGRRERRAPEGFAAFDRNIHRGRRLSAARAYLHPVRRRPNSTSGRAPSSPACCSTGPARPASRSCAGATEVVRAGEVILCGGAINSPQLLQLSGVGNADELRSLGVDVVHDLPGVGENLQDHLEVYVQHASTQPVSVAPAMKWRNRPWVGFKWLFFRSGPGRRTTSRARLRPLERRGDAPEPHVPLPPLPSATTARSRPAATATRCVGPMFSDASAR